MEIKIHEAGGVNIAEIVSDNMVINHAEDGLDLLGNLFFQGVNRVIIHAKDIAPGFFDLKTGIAGEILQKFSNYRVRLAIVGDFSGYESKSLEDFIFESNKTGHINFLDSVPEAIRKLSA